MAQTTSPFITGGFTIAATNVMPLVSWACNGFHQPVPDAVQGLLAAGLVTVGHLIYNLAVSALDKVEEPKPVAPGTPS